MKNDYEIRGDHVAIFIRKKEGELLEVLIDLEDLEKANEMELTWFEASGYALGTKKYRHGRYISPIRVSLHRWVMGEPKGLMIDHLNHNKLDNRKSNLRIVTNSENQQNRTKPSPRSRSGVLGVHWIEKNRKWQARVRKNGKIYCFGTFSDIEDAEKAVFEGKKKIHEYFANEVIGNVGTS